MIIIGRYLNPWCMKLAVKLGFVLANSRLHWFTTAVIFKHSFSANKTFTTTRERWLRENFYGKMPTNGYSCLKKQGVGFLSGIFSPDRDDF